MITYRAFKDAHNDLTNVPDGYNHRITNGHYTDDTARLAESAMVAGDIDKIYSVGAGSARTYWAVQEVVSGVPTWVQIDISGGGGLTNFTESVNSSVPNDTVPVVQLSPTNVALNVDVVLSPKGTGAILAQIPDNTATGGDKRGANAVDSQKTRTASSAVAYGVSSFCVGDNNTAYGDYSIASGQDNIASGLSSGAIGKNNRPSGNYSFCTGYGGDDIGITGKKVHSSSQNTALGPGTRQTGVLVLASSTTDATPTRMTVSGSGTPSATEECSLFFGQGIAFKGLVICKKVGVTSAATLAAFEIQGIIAREGAGTTILVGDSVTTISNTPGYNIALSADTTNDTLAITFTGLAATAIESLCTLYTTEVAT